MERKHELLERHQEIARAKEYDQDDDNWAQEERARRIANGWIGRVVSPPVENVRERGIRLGWIIPWDAVNPTQSAAETAQQKGD